MLWETDAHTHRHKYDHGLSQLLHDELHCLDVPDRVHAVQSTVEGRSHGAPMSTEPSTEISGRLLHSGLRRRHSSTFYTPPIDITLNVPRYRRSIFGRRAFSVGGWRFGTQCTKVRPYVGLRYIHTLFFPIRYLQYAYVILQYDNRIRWPHYMTKIKYV